MRTIETKQTPFYMLNSPRTNAEDFIKEGYKVISFGSVKSEIMNILNNKETAHKFHLFNDITDNDEEMNKIHDMLENIVFKECRSGKGYSAVGWENGNSYLRYHSGIIYKWFK